MDKTNCPFCKEEIIAGALICKHCHERILWTKEERIIDAISRRLKLLNRIEYTVPAFSPCKGFCYGVYKNNESGLKQCLKDCEAYEAIALLAERMNRELFDTFADIIWSGGDIDPIPFERAVRKRFSSMPDIQ